ncbi:MAG TPA: hypothetical protein VGZ25_16260, partial [Gemmataceae bacterium]|nr:hypothetical protein [Gemmataceae bacterium]
SRPENAGAKREQINLACAISLLFSIGLGDLDPHFRTCYKPCRLQPPRSMALEQEGLCRL